MHYFVSSHNGSGKCHESLDDAREEILLDLVNGIKDAVKRSDMWDVASISRLMVEACELEAIHSDWHDGDRRIEFDSEHHWSIETCNSYRCTDTVKRGSW